MITLDDFKKVEMRTGKIISAEAVEGSEKLLRLWLYQETCPRRQENLSPC
jgi:tRNA-binding EMAP/Myf-like protein